MNNYILAIEAEGWLLAVEHLRGGRRRWQSRVLLVLRVTAVLIIPLLVAAFSTQLVEALTTVTLMGWKEVSQIQAAHCFTCVEVKVKYQSGGNETVKPCKASQ